MVLWPQSAKGFRRERHAGDRAVYLVYILLAYATYVLLAVIVSTLLFGLGVVVVVVREALRALCNKLSRFILQQKTEANEHTGVFDTRFTTPAQSSCTSATKA